MQNESYQATEWMPRRGACGPTRFQNVRINIDWCNAEVERLKRKGIKAWVETNDEDMVAVFVGGTAQTWRSERKGGEA